MRVASNVALCSLLAAPLAAQTTERVSVDSAGAQANSYSYDCAISADGRFVAFTSDASNLVAGDTNGWPDVFVRDRLSGTTECVSVATNGAQADGRCFEPSLSSDGRFVCFWSDATNLVAGDTNGSTDIFVRDRWNGTTERVSVDSAGLEGNGDSDHSAISADGWSVAFRSDASNLVPGDTNGWGDVFVRDRLSGMTERVSVDSAGLQGDGHCAWRPSISDAGRFVAFQSSSTNLVAGDTNGWGDVFVRDRQQGTTVRVSVDSAGVQADNGSYLDSISADGRFVSFASPATNLVASDTNGASDAFVHDRLTGTTERVSVSTAGAQGNQGSGQGVFAADARYVAFASWATNLVAFDSNAKGDVFIHDRQTGLTERVSLSTAGGEGDSDSQYPSFSSDGQFVAFLSYASDLVTGDTNHVWDIFVRDRAQLPQAFCPGDGSAVACPCGNNGLPGRGCENSAATGGAVLSASGSSWLLNDTLVLTSTGELPGVPSILLQGSTSVVPLFFGDGLRCTGGSLKRLYLHSASGGVVSAPQPGDLSISARSAALGDVLGAGALRHYQTYYRDPLATFCPNPPGNGWNVSAGLSVTWLQ